MVSEKAAISPLPWCVGDSFDFAGGYIVAVRDPGGDVVADGVAPEDAEFIVKAVNCHDDLLAACREALLWYGPDGDHISEPARSLLLAAITKAEGA